jgi:hypothetical protein
VKLNHNQSIIADVLRWAITLIGVALAVRLVLTLFNLLFNFWATPLGHLLSEGELVARIADASPLGLARQLGVILAIATVIAIATRASRSASDQPSADHREQP